MLSHCFIRRRFAPLLSGLAAVAVGACAPAGPAATPGAPGVAESGKPERGGIFRFYVAGEPTNLEPYGEQNRAGAIMHGALYEGLIDVDRTVDWRVDFPIVARLAERWENPDPTTWLFHIRKEAKYSTGEPVTADDVVASLTFLNDPKNAFRNRSFLRDVATISKVDDGTVKITTKGPSPLFLVALAGNVSTVVAILPKKLIDQGVDAIATSGITPGPFKLQKYDKSSKTILVANEHYWGADKDGQKLPYLDGIAIVHNVDPSTRVAGFQAREFDILTVDTKAELDPLQAAMKDIKPLLFSSHHGYGLMPNPTVDAFKDIRVRKAFQLAFDRHEMNSTLAFGLGKITGPVVPAVKTGWGIPQEELLQMPGFRKDKTQDLAEAKRLMAEAGFPNGFKTDQIHVRTYVWTPGVGELAASQVKKINVDMQVRMIDQAEFTKAHRGKDFGTSFLLLGNPDPGLRTTQYLKTGAPDNPGWSDPQLDKYIDDLGKTLDVNEQKKIVRSMADLILEKIYYWPWLDAGSYYVTQPWVNDYFPGYSVQVDATGLVRSIWFTKGKAPQRSLD